MELRKKPGDEADRVHIPKPDGRERPIGIPALEDKIVQQAVRMILEPIYEQAFLGFSYGFRPKRSAHDALDAVATVIIKKRTDWVLDADIKSFFDTIDHGVSGSSATTSESWSGSGGT